MRKLLLALYSALILLNLWLGAFILQGWPAFIILLILSGISIGGVAYIEYRSRPQHRGTTQPKEGRMRST